jgi:translation initiation factor 6
MVNCTIGGSKIIGRMCVGNKNGLLIPKDTTDDEIKDI